MSSTIVWSIQYMSVSTEPINGENQVVLDAGWNCTATEIANIPNPQPDSKTKNTYIATAYGSCEFPQPKEGGQFTPYAQLTQTEVLGWCYENGVNKDEIEKSLLEQIDLQVNPPIITPPLPWTA